MKSVVEDKLERHIPFMDIPRKQVICKHCGNDYHPPLDMDVSNEECPYCGAKPGELKP
jgi:hypothetical protein